MVKPNFVWPDLLPGVTTSPLFIDSLLPILKNRCDRVILGESNGSKFNVEKAFESHGMYEICKSHGVELCNFSKMPSRFVKTQVGGRDVKIELPNIMMDETDSFITVPTLKTHNFTRVSISLKNQWGCIPDSMRLLYHPMLDRGIVAINKILKPKISLIDATYGLDGNGPIFGDPVRLDTLVVSDNIVAADAVGSRFMGFSPDKVKHIRLAEKEGLGATFESAIAMNGVMPQPLNFKVKLNLIDIAGNLINYSSTVNNLVYDSQLTPLIYKVLGRETPKRII